LAVATQKPALQIVMDISEAAVPLDLSCPSTYNGRMGEKRKNPHAVALAKKGAKKGGLARAAGMTAEQRSASARSAILARWGRVKATTQHTTAPTAPALDTSKEGLHLCLERLKNATSEAELRRLTEELQRIVFHKQYENAKA